MTYYIAVDIGCIECGESTNVLGIFTDEERAGDVCDEHSERQNESWHGQHSFEVFEIEEIDVIYPVNYS